MNMETGTYERTGTVDISVTDGSGSYGRLVEARVWIVPVVARQAAKLPEGKPELTGADGHLRKMLTKGHYQVMAESFGVRSDAHQFEITEGCIKTVQCKIPISFGVEIYDSNGTVVDPASTTVKQGGSLIFELRWPGSLVGDLLPAFSASPGTVLPGSTKLSATSKARSAQKGGASNQYVQTVVFQATAPGPFEWTAKLSGGSEVVVDGDGMSQPDTQNIAGDVGVSMKRTATALTGDLALWQGILNGTDALSFNNYFRFMNLLFCGEEATDLPAFEQDRFQKKRNLFANDLVKKRVLPFTDADAYRVVKAATEAFVMINCGILAPPRPFDAVRDQLYFAARDLPFPAIGLESLLDQSYLVSLLGGEAGDKTLPYLALIRAKLPDIAIKLSPFEEIDPQQVTACHGILQEKLTNPCLIELIWSYWHEEGMLVQTLNAITRRFQNVRGPSTRDPLANLEIDPLRPLNNLLWGYVQDEQHRLSVVRRNYEYDHHYGLRLQGKAVQNLTPADSRSKFIEAFHYLLRLCAVFFRQDDDTTVKADAFPVLNALKEVHLILSQGAHNQFGDLTSTARIEMLMQAWLLARPEFREFLPTRIMVAYPEPWMDRVDAMKKLQGWSDTSVLDFRNLALFGEQILLSIRYGNWSDIQDAVQAFNWARFFRPQIQGYSHAYRAVTGVDLTAESAGSKVDATLPSVLLQKRLAAERSAV
jgi:hypothetical protein